MQHELVRALLGGAELSPVRRLAKWDLQGGTWAKIDAGSDSLKGASGRGEARIRGGGLVSAPRHCLFALAAHFASKRHRLRHKKNKKEEAGVRISEAGE